MLKRSPLESKFWEFWQLRKNLPNSSCHFSKHKLVPTPILHRSSMLWYITLLNFSLAQTWYNFDKSSTSKSKFSDFPLLALKLTKFLTSFLEPRVSFSPNFESLVNVMIHTSSVLIHWKLYMFWTQVAHQSVNFQTFDYLHEN